MRRNNMIMYMFALMYSAFCMAGCDVHEFPDLPEKYELILQLNCNIEVPIYQEIDYTAYRSSDNTAEHDVRYILSVYRANEKQIFSRQADTTIVVTKELKEDRNLRLQLHLAEGLYQFMVWSDYVDKGSKADKYYNTTDFSEITYADRNHYEGCNDYKEAFIGSQQALIEIDTDAEDKVVYKEIKINLKRPFAKYKFISTDYGEFIGEVLEKAQSKGKTEPHTIDPKDYKVVFHYTGFMPCSFNMFTNKANDSWTSIYFEGGMKPLNENEVELGFDYFFVNEAETATNVLVAIYDKDGELLSQSNAVEVPLMRNKLTIIKGKFLTSKAGGNISVKTEFEGSYNIEIQ